MFKRPLKISSSLLIALTFVTLSPAAHATAIDVPNSADPSVLSRTLSSPSTRNAVPRDMISVTSDKEESAAGEGSDEKVFTLENVVLDDSTVYTKADIADILTPYVGKPTSLADLNAIANALTSKYRNDGYIFSRVVVPPQKVKEKVVHLRAVEGRVTDIKLTGDYQDDNGLIQSFADKIKTGSGPTRNSDVERYLLLINDLPGVTARAIMAPSQTPGGGELTIDVQQKPVEASLSADNRGTRYLGPYRGTAVVAANSLFGLHDRTTFRGISSADPNELLYGELTHEEQIGSEGTRLKARYARTRSRPGNTLTNYDIHGDSDTFDLDVMHPFLRSRQANFNVSAGFESLGSQSSLLGTKLSEDRVRSLRLGAHYDMADAWAGINSFDVAGIQGIRIFDATNDGDGRTRANGKQEFFRSTFTATRVQDLTNDFSMQVSGSGQWTPEALLASEEFTLGGTDFGRAYDAGEISGDQGIAGLAELRYGKDVDDPYLKAYQVFTYYDTGRVWNLQRVVGENSTDTLSSVGAGVRFNLAYDVSGSVELDQPLTRRASGDNDKGSRVFFTIIKRF